MVHSVCANIDSSPPPPQYYHHKYGVDFRSLRLPGVLSADTPPGGGTTDYAVHIFHEAARHNRYTCFLKPDTRLPMIYLPDCVNGIVSFLETPSEKLQSEMRLVLLRYPGDY